METIQQKPSSTLTRWATIAAILLLVVIGLLVFWPREEAPPPEQTQISLNPSHVENLSLSIARQRDLSEKSRQLRGDLQDQKNALLASLEDNLAQEQKESFPATQDYATSQPLEIALLYPPGSLVGYVTDKKLLPMEKVNISLKYEQQVLGGIEAPTPSASTDEGGMFLIEEIPTGRWTVIAEKEHYSKTVIAGQSIPSGEKTGPVTLTITPELLLSGTVNGAGIPVPNALVLAQRKHLSVQPSGRVEGIQIVYSQNNTDEKGAFSLKQLPHGIITIRAEASGFAPLEKELEIVPNMKPIVLELESEATLSGFVRNPRNEPVKDVEISLKRPDSPPKAKPLASTKTLETGEFILNQLPDGREYDLYAKATNYAPAGPIRILSGTSNNIIVLETGGAIEGSVTNTDTEEKMAQIGIVGILDSPSKRVVLWTKTNSGGNYRLENLSPGTYNIALFSEKYTSEPRLGVKVEKNQPTKSIDFNIYPGVTLTGTVEDGETGERLPNATVNLSSKSGPGLLTNKKTKATTKEDGTFRFKNLPQGVYNLTADLSGYTRGVGEEASIRVEALVKITPDPVRLKLYPGGTIKGVVYSGAGSPVGGALVQIYNAKGTPGSLGGGTRNKLKKTTESNGLFKMEGIPLHQELHLQVCAWNESLGMASSNIIILNRDQRDKTTEVLLGESGALNVKVMDDKGLGVSEAKVTISGGNFPRDTAPPGWVKQSDPTGNAFFAAAPLGNIRASASKAGYLSKSKSTKVTTSQVASVEITLATAHSISGKVYDDFGQPIQAGKVTAKAEPQATGGGSSKINPDGTFEIKTVGEGTFRLDVNAQKKTASGSRKILWGHPKNPPNDGLGEVHLVVPSNAIVTGNVQPPQGDDPLPNFRVTLNANYKDSAGINRRFNTAFTFSKSTNFMFDSLPPGEYKATINASNYLPVVTESFTIDSPSQHSLGTITLSPGGRLKINVVNSLTGEPVAGATGVLKPDGPSARTNANGEALFNPIVPGIYTLDLSHGEFLPKTVHLVNVPRNGERIFKDIEMHPGGTIFGNVVDGEDNSLKGILVEAYDPLLGEAKRLNTDAGGNYIIKGLSPGGQTMSYSGKVNNRKIAVSVNVKISAGEETQQDIVLWANSTLTGNLYPPPGCDPNQSIVRLYPIRADFVPMMNEKINVSNINNGRFIVEDLTDGYYLVTAQVPHPRKGTYYWAGTASVFEPDAHFTLHHGRGNIQGTVLSRPPGPVVDGQNVHLELLSATQSGRSGLDNFYKWDVNTDEKGLFAFDELPFGTYSLVSHSEQFNTDILDIIEINNQQPTYNTTYSFE
jgi:large repetitive protein